MYQGVPCFWVEETGRSGIVLRRYAREDSPCPAAPGRGYHNAESGVLEYRPTVYRDDTEHGRIREAMLPYARTDPNWPTACECGYVFGPEDTWQTNGQLEWRRGDTGELLVADPHGLPPGALWHLDWSPFAQWTDRYGDGINLYAMCPNRSYWNVDGPAYGEGRPKTVNAWTRTGDPRRPIETSLTVTPSIVAGDYHGFLTAGRFTNG